MKGLNNMARAGAVGIPVKYHINDLKRLRKKYKPGMRLQIVRTKVDGEEYERPRREIYTVVRPYPYFVSCRDSHGHLVSPGYFELEQQATII